jgi:predicted DCC family thiol-disulfide oxidoreductase YuxK
MARPQSVLIYDGECGLCLRTRKLLEPLDLLRAIRWIPYQSPEAQRFGIPRGEMERSIQFLSGGRRWSGFGAMKRVALCLPPLYALAGLLVARKPALAIPIALVFSPLFQPAGDFLYGFVSDHRHAVPLGSCRVRPARFEIS